MKTLVHISDLHFGREDPDIVAGLIEAIAVAHPDVIVVSGDLTQRAKKRQFRAARSFLRALPKVPRIIVPGNHDVSATNIFERTLRPLARYKRFITDDLAPFVDVGEIAVAGINTVRIAAVKDGRMNIRQVRTTCDQLARAGDDVARIVVTHHPIDMPVEDLRHKLVARSRMAMGYFSRCKVDLFLSGHLHSGQTILTSTRYKLAGYSAIVAHAGTAVSTRTRGEPNAWNLIQVDHARVDIQQMEWDGKRFEQGPLARYAKGEEGWSSEVS